MRLSLSLLLFTIILSGCSALSKSQELLTLKRVADEQAAIAKYVEKRDASFEDLQSQIQSGDIKEYKDKRAILRKYGKPIFKVEDVDGNIGVEEWIYRYETQLTGSPTANLVFNQKGHLITWYTTKGDKKHGKVRQEAP